MSNLTILNTAIRQLDNLFCLNDLHTISGNEDKHRPSLFIRLDTTKELIDEIAKEVRSTDLIFKTLRGRNIQGTYACKELVIAYAAWISPAFHLTVLRAFLNQAEQQPKQLALPVPENKITLELTETELKHLAWLWKMSELMRGQLYALYEPLNQLGSRHAAGVYGKSREYKSPIEACRKILVRATQHIQTDKWDSNGWNNVIHELRDGEPRTLY